MTSKAKRRSHTSADAPKPYTAPQVDTPGAIGSGKLGVYDAGPKGDGVGRRLRGQVGGLATSATASRFNGKLGSKLGPGPDGNSAWLAPTLAETSAQGTAATPDNSGPTLANVSSKGATATKIKPGG